MNRLTPAEKLKKKVSDFKKSQHFCNLKIVYLNFKGTVL